MTREEAIGVLLDNDIFWETDIDEKSDASEFYIKNLMEGLDMFDIDRYAWLNTLFGYDIGEENAYQIDHILYTEMVPEVEVLDLTYMDKGLLKNVVEKLKLNLTFDKWIDHDVSVYSYF